MAADPGRSAVGVLYYVVFRFAIAKFNLKTPGREDDDAEELKATLANNDYTSVAKTVLEGVGGPENVASIDNCITRLRLEVKDYTKVNEKSDQICRCCRCDASKQDLCTGYHRNTGTVCSR